MQEDTSDKKLRSKLINRLFSGADRTRTFEATYHLHADPQSIREPYSLLESLGIRADDLSNHAREGLEAAEELNDSVDSSWIDFRWKLSAFLHIQDIFDATLERLADPKIIFEQYYFYCESRIILTESIISGLSGLYISSSALLRPFLEFSLLQNYYYRITKYSDSYSLLEKYFKTRKHPSWNTIIKKCLPEDSFFKPI